MTTIVRSYMYKTNQEGKLSIHVNNANTNVHTSVNMSNDV